MRIAYHNPWIECAENQAYSSLAIAGGKLGVEIEACADHRDIEAANPDFVLSIASTVPKMVDIVSYLTVHEPAGLFLDYQYRLNNLLSYDGYLTISDTLNRFLRDLCFGVGRPETPGFYYNTPQTVDLAVQWRARRAHDLKVIYFGSNWDRRSPELFKQLDKSGILRIHGAAKGWASQGLKSYAGPVPFDGLAPQRVYARHGIGLALLADPWHREDVISNRLFEIVSVGAVAICPDMPWTRKWFGDAVLYFDPGQSPKKIARQIARHYEFCGANPSIAGEMGAAAREIFEKTFCAEKMLVNLLEYHDRKTAERKHRRARLPEPPEISVVLRCGGRPIRYVERAVNSIRNQTYGRFTVILVKYKEIDVSRIAVPGGAIRSFDEILIPDGRRGTTLFEGVRRVQTPYFAVLDDDDFWLSEHFEELFRAGRRVRGDFYVAFSGRISFDRSIAVCEGLFCDRNISSFGFTSDVQNILDTLPIVSTNCFVARRDLLPDEMLEPPEMDTAEDSLLVALLARHSKPTFSYRATAFYRHAEGDGSDWAADPRRKQDELTFSLRAGLSWSPRWLNNRSFAIPAQYWEHLKHDWSGGAKPASEHLTIAAAPPNGANGAAPPPNGTGSAAPSFTFNGADTQIEALRAEIAALHNSTSWRVTAPMRGVMRRIRGH